MIEKNTITHCQPLLLNATESAKLCGCTAKIWRHRTDYGLTPKPIKFGNRNFWRPEELVDWVAARCPKREDWDYSPKKSDKSGKSCS